MAFGTVGSPDGQRANVWDPGAGTYALQGAQNVPVTSSAIPTTQWGYVYASASMGLNNGLFKMDWYTDHTLLNHCGGITIPLSPTAIQPIQILLPNLGPWLKITHTNPVGAGVFQANTRVVMTNRAFPRVGLASTPFLSELNPNLVAGGNVIVDQQCFYSGDAGIFVNGGSQGVVVSVLALDLSCNPQTIESYQVAANASDYRVVKLPPTSCQYELANLSGAVANNTSSLIAVGTLAGG